MVSGTLVTFSLGVLWEGMGKALWAGVGHRGRYQSIRDVLVYLRSQDGWPKSQSILHSSGHGQMPERGREPSTCGDLQ